MNTILRLVEEKKKQDITIVRREDGTLDEIAEPASVGNKRSALTPPSNPATPKGQPVFKVRDNNLFNGSSTSTQFGDKVWDATYGAAGTQPAFQFGPTIQPGAQPTAQPGSQPTTQPGFQFGSQPTAQFGFQPGFQPAAPSVSVRFSVRILAPYSGTVRSSLRTTSALQVLHSLHLSHRRLGMVIRGISSAQTVFCAMGLGISLNRISLLSHSLGHLLSFLPILVLSLVSSVLVSRGVKER